MSPPDPTPARRVRLTPDRRRRQLVAIGLRKLTEQPVHELSLDDVATEAQISRGLLFHYFATKSDYYSAVAEAACHRVMRNVTPDETVTLDPRAALEHVAARLIEQIDRRRDLYLALVYGRRGAFGHDDQPFRTLRDQLTDLVTAVMEVPTARRRRVHAWVAYLEDLALQWSETPLAARDAADALAREAVDGLEDLLSR